MKHILLVGAVLSVTLFVHGLPFEQTINEITFPITFAAVECGLKVNKDLVTKHPELKEWATAMYIITNSFAESNIECAKLPFSDQRRCYDALTIEAKRTYDEVINLLPENLREQFQEDFYTCFE